MKTRAFIYYLPIILLLSTCYPFKDELSINDTPDQWSIPDDFDFKTYQEVNLEVNLFPFGNSFFEIYLDRNCTQLLTSFKTDAMGSYKLSNVKIPSYLENLYIKSTLGDFTIRTNQQILIDHTALEKNASTKGSRIAGTGRGNSGKYFGYYCAHAQISHDFDLVFLSNKSSLYGAYTPLTVSFFYDEALTQPAYDFEGRHSIVVGNSDDGLWSGQSLKISVQTPIRYFYVQEFDEVVEYSFSCDDISNIDGKKTVVNCLGKYLNAQNEECYLFYASTPDNNDAYHYYNDDDYPWWFSYATVEWVDANTGAVFYTTEFADVHFQLNVNPKKAVAKRIIFNRGDDEFILDYNQCSDEISEYPHQFSLYYPYKNGVATMAFEDLWPETGDYDFNDLVVEYNIEFKYNSISSYATGEATIKYTIRHVGAALKSGFAVHIPAIITNPYDGILFANGMVRTENFINDDPDWGTEKGHEKDESHVVLFDNASKLVSPYSNVEKYQGTVVLQAGTESDLRKLEFYSFSNTQIDSLKYLGRRSKEIHEPDNPGSKLMYQGFYGIADDTSDPSTGRYYKTKNNLPWAFTIPAPFNIPDEKEPITKRYPRFKSWAESGGTIDKDWYLD